MKALVIGASGQVGRELMRLLERTNGADALGTYSKHPAAGLRQLDITSPSSVASLFKEYEPDTVFLCAAMAHVDLCQEQPVLARKVNVSGPANVAAACACKGTRLVFVSTDYVFDGSKGMYAEGDAPAPLNEYGRSKLEAENRIGGLCRNLVIARTAMVYSYNPSSSNFAMQLLNNSSKGTKMRVADDIYASPTYAPDLAVMLLKLAESGKTGLYHATGGARVSRLEFAKTFCKTMGLDDNFIDPVPGAVFKPKAPRPPDSSLSVDKIKRDTGHFPLDYEKGLKLFKQSALEAGI